MNADEAKELLELQHRMQQLHGVMPKPKPRNEFAEAMIDTLAAKAEQAAETDTEYLAEDGLLHCKICGGKRQTVIQPPFEGAASRKVRCWCQCPTELDRARAREKDVQTSRNRSVCFQGVEELRNAPSILRTLTRLYNRLQRRKIMPILFMSVTRKALESCSTVLWEPVKRFLRPASPMNC